jgi:uncharacterized membrane protein YhaH (DUF805 family)
MQETAVNWTVFGLTLAGLFVFGVLYAMLVRSASKRNLEGQIAWAVVVGVAATLAALIPLLGLMNIALAAAGFTASGIPMIVEYLLRANKEHQSDKEKAQALAKEILK